MDTLSLLPDAKAAVLARMVETLRTIPGVAAIALGGSYAAGTARAGSDVDLGLYYAETHPFAIPTIRQMASEFSVHTAPTVTDFYEWGRWVNGGAWIQTVAGKVDFLYRNLDQVAHVIADALQGHVEHDYGQQPAYGFYSVIYLAETQVCQPLHDPYGKLAELKRKVEPYPPRLKAGIVQNSLWSAAFSLLFARSFAAAGDVYNTVGCLTRVAANLTQVLFALNERYFLSDKQVMDRIAEFRLRPERYGDRMSAILAAPGASPDDLQHSIGKMTALWQEVVALAGSLYAPRFQL